MAQIGIKKERENRNIEKKRNNSKQCVILNKKKNRKNQRKV